MVAKILQLGDPRLRQSSNPVECANISVAQTIWADLEDTLGEAMRVHHFRVCAGLSAVQIGIMRRACLLWFPTTGFIHIANPVLVWRSDRESIEFEGCLSFFDQRGLVPRPEEIRVSFHDRSLQPREGPFCGWQARLLLHEMDHMDGILYTDRMRSTDKPIEYAEYQKLKAVRETVAS